MTPPLWILEYVKREIDRRNKEAAEKPAEKVATEPKPKKEKKKASKPKRDDRASGDQVKHTIDTLTREGFTNVVLPLRGAAYFSQGDSRWAKLPFPKWKKNRETGQWERVDLFPKTNRKTGEVTWEQRTLQGGGCGPTSLAIAIATLRPDSGLTPTHVAEFAIEKHYSGDYDSSGANMKMVKPLTEEHGLVSKKIKNDAHKIDALRDGLNHGGVAVVHVGAGIFNYPKGHPEKKPSGGHFIAVIGYAVGPDPDKQEWFFVANPGKDGSVQDLPDKGLRVDTSLEHHGAGMVRVSRETLERLMKESYMVTDPKAAAPPAE